MSNKTGDKQAFPVPPGIFSGGETWNPTEGMTLREHYVGQALAGFCANMVIIGRDKPTAKAAIERLAGAAVEAADAAIKTLED